jgi:tricarballylate dehydrogenase
MHRGHHAKEIQLGKSPRPASLLGLFNYTGGITFTFGGLQINESAQALNTSGNPIRGLYASGDIVGLFFHNYPSCTGQTRNVVFSRLAGRHAAAQGL